MPQQALIFHTYAVVASPVDDAEVVIAILDQVDTIWPGGPVNLHGWVDVAPDADAANVRIRVRRGGLTGDAVGEPGTVAFDPAATANTQVSLDVQDTPGNLASATYVLTMECESASAASTVGSVHLSAQV